MQDSTTDDGPGYGLPRQINTLSLSLSLSQVGCQSFGSWVEARWLICGRALW